MSGQKQNVRHKSVVQVLAGEFSEQFNDENLLQVLAARLRAYANLEQMNSSASLLESPVAKFCRFRCLRRFVFARRNLIARTSARRLARHARANARDFWPPLRACAKNAWQAREIVRALERAKRHLSRRLQLLFAIENLHSAGRKIQIAAARTHSRRCSARRICRSAPLLHRHRRARPAPERHRPTD